MSTTNPELGQIMVDGIAPYGPWFIDQGPQDGQSNLLWVSNMSNIFPIIGGHGGRRQPPLGEIK